MIFEYSKIDSIGLFALFSLVKWKPVKNQQWTTDLNLNLWRNFVPDSEENVTSVMRLRKK